MKIPTFLRTINGPWIFQTWNPVTRRTSKLGSLQRVKFGTNRLNLKLLVSEQCFQFGWHARVCKTLWSLRLRLMLLAFGVGCRRRSNDHPCQQPSWVLRSGKVCCKNFQGMVGDGMAHMVLPFPLEPPLHCMNAKEGVSVMAMAFNISKGIVAGWHFFFSVARKKKTCRISTCTKSNKGPNICKRY